MRCYMEETCPPATTRDRILEAAVARFASGPYSETGLREIAADAGVSVAYVHRLFGSKAELFREVLQATMSSQLLEGDPATLPDRLATEVLEAPARSTLIATQSLACADAHEIMRGFVQDRFVGLLEQRADCDGLQATLLMSMLAGFCTMHHVLGLPAFANATPEERHRRLSRAFAALLVT